MSESRNAKVSGNGTISGGEYDIIAISGAGKIDGDCKANEVRISGVATVSGRCEAKTIKVSGTGKLGGSVKAGLLKVSGSANASNDVDVEELAASGRFRAEGNITGGKVKASGSLKCDKSIKCKEVDISGHLNADSVECEKFVSRGIVKIENMLNSEVIDMELEMKCSVGEIGGKNIKIVGSGEHKLVTKLYSVFSGNKGAIELDTKFIEGDEIYLENVRVKEVGGQNVEIGKNCIVEKVSYSNSLKIDSSAQVKEKARV